MFAVIVENDISSEVVGPFNTEEAADAFIEDAYKMGDSDHFYRTAEILDPDYFIDTF